MVHEIVFSGDGNRVGTDGQVTVTLLGTEGQMFKRRAIKNACTPEATEECWLVAELNGVRVYQRGSQVIVTTEDLYP